MDKISVKGLRCFAHHGVYPEETKLGQEFIINIEAYRELREAGLSDDLSKSVSYGEIAKLAYKVATENTFKLLEALCETICRELLLCFDLKSVTVEVEKPNAPIPLNFDTVSVSLTRSWHTAYLSVGSNMGDKQEHIDNAIDALNECPDTRVTRVSSFISTKPYGNVEQDDFLNGCLEIETLLSPFELLDRLNSIEAKEGRERLVHWGPRTLDLDIVFYDDITLYSDRLKIPHCDMQNREFVLRPLEELIPYYRHPVLGESVSSLLSHLLAKFEL